MPFQSGLFVAYHCPHCGVALQAEDDGWSGWRRCPACARLALPPKVDPRVRLNRSSNRNAASSAGGSAEVDGIAAPEDAVPEQFAQTGSSPAIGPARVIFRTGLILSLALVLISYLDQNSRNAAIFGALAVIFFFLLLRLPRKRREEDGVS
jgi:hypothetical protein